MKYAIFITYLFALFCILSIGRVQNKDSEGHDNKQMLNDQQVVNARQFFRLPKMLDFDNFKQSFNKHYGSVVEELLRRKFYLGRAFRAFISNVCYKYKKASSYLAINYMSDWTLKEVEDLYMKKSTYDDSIRQQQQQQQQQQRLMSIRPANLMPEVSIEDLERELAEIESHKDEVGYKEIYNELQGNLSEKDKSKHDNMNVVHSENDQPADNNKLESNSTVDKLYEPNNVDSSTGDSLGIGFLRYVIKTAIDTIKNPISSRRAKSNGRKGHLSKDYRKSDCYSPPRNQAKCGSCYVFAAVALYEFLFCQVTGVKASFSEQYVVDCGEKVGELLGCRGGRFVNVSDFFQEFGIELQQTYPYVGQQNQCPYNDEDPPDKRGYLRIEDNKFGSFPSQFFDRILNKSPFIINILLNREFSEYGGGVDRMLGCWSGDSRLHSVVVVGSGIEDGEDFWLIRNSFGTGWGEDGHHKLYKHSGCIDNNEGYIPRVVFKEKYEDNLNPKYDLETLASRIKQHQSTWNKLKRAYSS